MLSLSPEQYKVLDGLGSFKDLSSLEVNKSGDKQICKMSRDDYNVFLSRHGNQGKAAHESIESQYNVQINPESKRKTSSCLILGLLIIAISACLQGLQITSITH